MKGAAWLLALFALLEIGHPWPFEALRYDRDGLLHGQIWRALPAPLVHLGPVPAAMNSLAVLLLVALCQPQWTVWGWCWRSAALAVPISLGLLAAVPALASYVGFSGVAHGLFVLALWPLAVKGDWIARGCLLSQGADAEHQHAETGTDAFGHCRRVFLTARTTKRDFEPGSKSLGLAV